MNSKLLITIALAICLLIPTVFAGTTHCWRQEIDRGVGANEFMIGDASFDAISGVWIATIGTRMDLNGFGSFQLNCDDGASGSGKNYVDVLDATDGNIVATNVTGNLGPAAISGGYCMYNGSICYKYKGAFYPRHGACDAGTDPAVGAGELDAMSIVFDENSVGYHEYVVRYGALSPATADPYSPNLWMQTIKVIKVFVGMPGLLTFNQQRLKRMGYYDKDGTAEIDVIFTVLNKSPFTARVTNYNMVCNGEVTCELPQVGGHPEYVGYTIKTDQPLVIPAKVKFNKRTTLPEDFFASLEMTYSIDGLAKCDLATGAATCQTRSAAMEYKIGLLDKQDFQINILGSESERDCVDAEGNPGRTGPELAPRVNLSFNPSTVSYDCSNINPITGADNPNWVYCSQKEFLVQLSRRIGEGWIRLGNIKIYEKDGNAGAADALRVENGRILTFNAYLRAQDISRAQVSANASQFGTGLLTSVNLPGTVFDSGATAVARMKNLVNSINFKQSIGGVRVDETMLEPGMYQVSIDMNDIDLSSAATSTLFKPDGSINPAANIKVTLEKQTPPAFDWFFYYDEDSASRFAGSIYGGGSTATTFNKTNIQDRGLIVNFTKSGSSMSGTLYKTIAIPLIARIADTNLPSVPPAKFDAQGSGLGQSNFTYWTGFASSLPAGPQRGCETISLTPPLGNKALPYRIADINAGLNNIQTNIHNYTIEELVNVAPNSVMYLETVLYMPVGSGLWIQAPFKISTLNGTTTSTPQNPQTLNISPSDQAWASVFKIDGTSTNNTLENIFDKIADGNVCVIRDTSQSATNWRLFWNQTAVLNALNPVRTSIRDANLCAARQQLSS